ncbi:MAG: MATE family efflux transporter [Acidobacteriota bacterium]
MNKQEKNIFRDIVEAVKGTEQDFTSGSIRRAILLLAIPMVLEMAMESVFAVVDIFFVSRIGPEAVATVGITESVMTILYAISLGLGMGTTALISRRVGEKDYERASLTAVHSIGIGIVLSIPIAFLGIYYAPELLKVMGSSDSMIENGYRYPMITIGGNIVIMLLFIINSIFRGAGDAALSMRVLWISNIINIFLDPCLIFGLGPFPELGIAGAATATLTGRSIGVMLQFYYLFRGKHRIKIQIKKIKVEFKIIKKLIRISLGGIGQFLISTSSWIGLVRIMSSFGSSSLAGYTIAIRILIFSLLPSWGLSNAANTMVGQNLGAKKPERAEKAVKITAFANFIFLSFVGLVFYFFPSTLVNIFTNEPEVIKTGIDTLKYISFAFPFYAIGLVVIQAINGSGDTRTPTIINFFCFWLMEIPVAYILAFNFGMNEKGVYFAIVLADIMLTTAAVYVFKKGKWKKKIV